MVRVAVHIVTFNSGSDIEACMRSVQGQTFADFEVRVLDNASTDDSAQKLAPFRVDVRLSATNLGFAQGHNELMRSSSAEYVLVLNPDTILEPAFLDELVKAMDSRPDAGSATGKLLRFDGRSIDSTGIIMLRSQRHLDRGADQPDTGQFESPEDVFGPSGAAALYRMSALRDVSFESQFFDEDFFAYREDADLAWRLQLMGWPCLYVPSAIARHRRRVTPERRRELSPLINYHSVKNRFLLRINNMTSSLYRRDFWAITARDSMVIGYVLFREWSSLKAFTYLVRHARRLWRKRRLIQSRRRISGPELDRWFYNDSGVPNGR